MTPQGQVQTCDSRTPCRSMGVALPTLVVLVLIGCGFRSVEAALSFGTQHPSCNQACGLKGASPTTAMDQYGATPKPGKCYRCWDTAYGGNCPAWAQHRSDGWRYDTCCDAAYDCSCSTSSTLSGQCTSSEVGDGKCQAWCKTASCGNDGSDYYY
jgi:hypothetical protein